MSTIHVSMSVQNDTKKLFQLFFLTGTLEERLAVKNAAKASLKERAVEEYEHEVSVCNLCL